MLDTKLEFLVVAVGVVLALIGIAAPLVNWGAVGRSVRRAIRHCRRVVSGATDEPNFKVVPLDFEPHIEDLKKLRGVTSAGQSRPSVKMRRCTPMLWIVMWVVASVTMISIGS